MKKTLINIWAYDHHAKFTILAEDTTESVEKAVLDKIGEKSIKWEYLGSTFNQEIKRITYEEVINDTRPIQTKKVLGVEVATGASR
jgi:lysyl-tRNA synthetase class II